jgi:site-specific DNA recombinase
MQAKQPTDVSRIAVIYCRVSDGRQRDNYSLETQEAACLELCATEGLTVLAALREVHSGADWDRPIFQDALDHLRRGEAGVIVVHALDRFMRDQDGNVRALFEIEQELGCRAVSALEKLGDSAEDKLLRGVFAYVAEKERQKIRERTTRGRRARVERDGFPLPGPTAPYGYRWVYETRGDGRQRKTRLEEDPTTAPIVRRIFQEVANGAKLGEVARGLDADGIPTPSQARPSTVKKPIAEQWAKSTLQKMLANPYYAGAAQAYRWQAVKRKERSLQTGRAITRRSQRKRTEPGISIPAENVPALVTADEWQMVQEQLARNKEDAGRNTRWPANQLLRAGIAVCGYCGRPMYVKHLGPNPRRREIGSYVCAARYSWPRTPCEGGSPSVAVNILDADIWEKVVFLLTTDAVSVALERRETGQDGGNGGGGIAEQRLTREIATHDGLIADHEKKLKNLLRMQSEADDDDTYAYAKTQAEDTRARLGRLRAQRDELVGQRESLAQTARIAEHLLMSIPGGVISLPQNPRTPDSLLENEATEAWLRTAFGEDTSDDQARLKQVGEDIRERIAGHIQTHWSYDDKRAVLRWLGVRVEVTRRNDPQPPEGKHWRISFSLDGVLADLADIAGMEGIEGIEGVVRAAGVARIAQKAGVDIQSVLPIHYRSR